MSQESHAAHYGWLTIVTLRVSFQSSTFSPSFRDKLKISTSPKLLCSCSQLSDLHPLHNAKNTTRGLLPSDHISVRFIISGPEKVAQAKRLCTPQANQQFGNAREFRFWIRSLAIQLSELCESDHTRDPRSEQGDLGIRPFRTGSLTNKTVCEELGRLLNTSLSPSDQHGHGMGYVYVLRSQIGPSTMPFLKIGFSKFHPEHRAHELARCLARPEVVHHTPLIPHAKRIESIIHTELQSCRKVQFCLKCYKDHREWFAVSHAESREVLTRWSMWILQQPYVDGKLSDDWREYLLSKNFKPIDDSTSLAAFWTTLIEEFPQGGSKDERSKRIGKYLNDCHWNVLCDQIGATYYGKDYCDLLRKDMPQGPRGITISRDDLQARFDALGEELRDCEMRDNERDDGYEMNDCDAIANLLAEGALSPGRSRNDPIDAETPLSEVFSTNTYLGRMFHPETKARHLLNSDKSLGPLSRLIQREETESKIVSRDMLKVLESIKTVKTGALSVSDPLLGITESPLGDATMLPVLSIKDLGYLSPVVVNWIGMSPTHVGFQYVQEAYANGEWFGKKPRFKLPKAYRRAGYKNLAVKDTDNVASSKRRAKVRAKSGRVISEALADDVDPSQSYDRPSFQLTRGPEFDEFQWAAPLNEANYERANKIFEEIRDGGRARVEEQLAKCFRDVGLDTGTLQDESMIDSDAFVSSDSSSGESEGGDLHADPGAEAPPAPAKRRQESAEFVNAKKVKLWLQSQ